METSFINMQILVHLHVNKTNFHMKGFALGLVLTQRRKATRKSPIVNVARVEPDSIYVLSRSSQMHLEIALPQLFIFKPEA